VPRVGANGFWLVISAEGDRTVLTLHGELDLSTVPSLAKPLQDLLHTGVIDLTLDARHLSFADSAALSVVLETADELKRRGGRLRLEAPSPPLRRLLSLARCEGLLGSDV
jgi:anti-anti-sigma factor